MFDVSKYALASSERLLNMFHEGFNVVDLAQPLLSLDEGADIEEARKLLKREGVPVLGVRQAGRVAGYLLPMDIKNSASLKEFNKFDEQQLLDDTSNIEDLFLPISNHKFVFVEVVGEVACIVTRDDLEKPPMRMWLFGIITLVEMNVSWAVEQIYPNGGWKDMISASRLEKALELQNERKRRHQDSTLLSCLQFSDKLNILTKEQRNREIMNMSSRAQAKDLIKKLESLRNNLAHAQPVIEDNWDVILRLSRDIDKVVSAPGMRRLVEHVKGEL